MIYRMDMDGPTRLLVSHLSPSLKKRLKESLRSIAKDPHLGKALQENLVGLYSYRVGSWRIVYSLNLSKKLIQIIAVGPRRTIYEDLEKGLAKFPMELYSPEQKAEFLLNNAVDAKDYTRVVSEAKKMGFDPKKMHRRPKR